MRGNGKKMFPGKTKSNIFFIENKNKTNINPDKYVNKNNNYIDTDRNKNNLRNINNINSFKNNNNNQLIITKKQNISINENRKRHNSMEIFNSNKLQINNNSIFPKNKNINNKRKVLYTERSVDSLRPRRVLGNFSTSNYILNKNNFWTKRRSMDISSDSRLTEYKPLNTNLSLHQNKNNIRDSPSNLDQKKTSKNYYNKFVNKSNSVLAKNYHKKIYKNKKNNAAPKEQTFIIKKIKQDDNLIDINALKKHFSKNGINIISLSSDSTSLIPINRDSIKLILNSNDVKSNKFKNIERYFKREGLEANELKNNYHIKFTRGIYPNQSGWDDITYGGREKFEKAELSSRFEKDEKEKKFHKKNMVSKNNFANLKYKNNFKIKPKIYNSVDK